MIKTLSIFIEDNLMTSEENKIVGMSMRKTIGIETFHQKGLWEYKIETDSNKGQKYIQNLKIEDIDDLELAKQLTILEYSIFTQIKPQELLGNAWTNNYKVKSNVQISTMHFNQISSWITSSILEEQNFKKRKSKLTRAYMLAIHLYQLNNFDSFLAVCAGIQTAAIHRLKKTKAAIDPKLITEYQTCLNIMKNENSYKAYRDHISNKSPPLLPYLGIYLTDLTFIEDGNKNILLHSETQRPLINWSKKILIHNILKQILKYQNHVFNIEPIDQIQGLLGTVLSTIYPNEDDLWKLSLTLEPREK
jgi:son of sevenless